MSAAAVNGMEAAARPVAADAVRLDFDGDVLVAECPVSHTDVRSALARLRDLALPAKLAAARNGGLALRAELLRAPGVASEALARRALEGATAWLAGRDTPAIDGGGELDAEMLSEALLGLPVAWGREAVESAAFRVHATAFGVSARVQVEASRGSARVSIRSAVPASEGSTCEALLALALEVNRRLRLSRVSVAFGEGAASLVWDALASPGVPLDRALPIAVQAVLGAHARTRRSFRVLARTAVARAHLAAIPTSVAATDGHAARERQPEGLEPTTCSQQEE